MSTSTNSTGRPASGACNTASARTAVRVPLLLGRFNEASVDKEPTVPIPRGPIASASTAADGTADPVCCRGTDRVGAAGARVIAMMVSCRRNDHLTDLEPTPHRPATTVPERTGPIT
ncbi:hypothetical protein [Streptomyces sp. NPDC060001]|uniref:hypothetical protein n=1 Tax=Streptomyces sp. NPDC060001 TaxID=3347032 RepID=UPI0036BD6553